MQLYFASILTFCLFFCSCQEDGDSNSPQEIEEEHKELEAKTQSSPEKTTSKPQKKDPKISTSQANLEILSDREENNENLNSQFSNPPSNNSPPKNTSDLQTSLIPQENDVSAENFLPESHNSFGISFSQKISASTQRVITGDITWLAEKKNFSNTPASLRLVSILDIEEVDGEKLVQWLTRRISYFVGPNPSAHAQQVVFPTLNRFYDKNPDTLPTTTLGLAQNYGSNQILKNYAFSQKVQDLTSEFYHRMRINDEWIDISTPRAGILSLGENFIQQSHLKGSPLVSSIFRLSIFFHLARHSDGNKKSGSLGLPHGKCPAGLGPEISGTRACDTINNGGYAVSAYFLKTILDSCQICSTSDHIAIEQLYLDSFQRIQPPDNQFTLVDAKAELHQQIALPKNLKKVGNDKK